MISTTLFQDLGKIILLFNTYTYTKLEPNPFLDTSNLEMQIITVPFQMRLPFPSSIEEKSNYIPVNSYLFPKRESDTSFMRYENNTNSTKF